MSNRTPVSLILKGIDQITLLFCTWMLALIGIGWNRVQEPLTHGITYLSIIAGVLVLVWLTAFLKEQSKPENCPNNVCRVVRPKLYAVLAFIRSYYPILLFLYFFESTSATNRVFFTDWLDPFFLSIDKAIWGYLPSLEWGIRYGAKWISEWLHFAYFSYYLMIGGLPILFYIKRRKALNELVFVLSLVFYFCYFIFSWLPVIGGRFYPQAMQWTVEMGGGLFSDLMAKIYTWSPHLGGAFPSSHIAIALVLSLQVFKYFKAVGSVCLFLTFFLSIATVYCHYHWFIDAVFGVLTGLLGYWAAQKIFKHLAENKYEG
jgi:membrane-associated phospholipid phosphatase